ncbi:hypothetical protein [Hyphomicrobium sp.]|uniref:hypothetical protein n=1 Tax=Hyphomicrobium sp. TaxID=82 RepID=UPI002C91CD6D|nr:hypothetical protein [Hyphomicrobium sp.]HRN89073.1 hypothetical protein [Hyphomicrobium sp.]HRQ28005.1 hypothetical protein [Hyphomicrobium sp.]
MTEQMQAEIAELNHRLEEIDDPRRSYALVLERIRSYRSRGQQVPEPLTLMERRLARECLIESQGR